MVPFRTNPESDAVIRRAAEKRGISVSAYVRRAAVAFAAADTGEDWSVLMANEPRLTTYSERGNGSPMAVQGHGFGPWKIIELGSYDE